MLKGKLPSEVVNERHQQVNAFKQFVQEQKKKLQEVLEHLGLTEESLSKVQLKQVCPHNPNHFVPEKSFKKHVERCRLLKAGCQEDELPSQLQNTDFCYEGKNSLKIELDESLMNKIIWDDCVQSGEVYTGHRTMPVSHIDENINLTQNDRFAIYQYVVNKSHEAGKVIQVDKSDELLTTDWGSLVKKGLLDAQNSENYSSKLEQLAALRDMKRRRQSYRAKNVHITKKSYTEIIKEVILNQMELLVPADSKKPIKESDPEDHKLKSRERKRGERDRNDNRDSHNRHKRSRSKSRNREKRRRFNDDEGLENDDTGSVRSMVSELQSQPSRYDDLEVKKEPTENFNADSINNEGYDIAIANLHREEGEGNSGKNISNEAKQSRSQSQSSSLSSSEEHHHHHKKSKHKKKSKRSKKHSKKHKRSEREKGDN